MIERLVQPSRGLIDQFTALMNRITGRHPDKGTLPDTSLTIRGYNLVLMDQEGQVVWTRDWDAGGAFEFGPRHSLWVFCEFTNRSNRETEISEYEIELLSEEGEVVERFGNSFGDSLLVRPGQSCVFSGEWKP